MRALLLVPLLALACEPEVEDTGGEVDTLDTQDPFACDEGHRITWTGPEQPMVGDAWTVMLRCGDVPELGPYVVRVDPVDFATIDETTVTWQLEGTAELTVQVGGIRERMDVTVLPP